MAIQSQETKWRHPTKKKRLHESSVVIFYCLSSALICHPAEKRSNGQIINHYKMTGFPTSAQEWMKSWHAANSPHPKLKTDESHHA